MAGIQIGQLPDVTTVQADDYLPLAQDVTGPNTGTTYKAKAAQLSASIAGAFNVMAYGAVGNGSANDTAALQACFDAVGADGGTVLIPEGIYKFSAPLKLYSNTNVLLRGTLVAAPIGQWAGSPYHGLTNKNNTASSITDENICIVGGTIDYTALPSADGSRHTIYMRMVRNVHVEGVRIVGGSSAIAFLGCENTLELGNTYTDFSNCGSDHWEGPKNNRVIGCHIQTAAAAQMVNFNPDPTVAPSTGYVAEGFVLEGCTIVSTENPATPIQIEPLRANALVRNVVVTGNVFKNVWIACRADTSGMVINNNVFSAFQGTSEVIASYDRFGTLPGDIIVAGNIIQDPLTSAGNEAVIRVKASAPQVLYNTIKGSAYLASPITTGTPPVGQIFGNYTDGATNSVPGRLQTGMILATGGSNYYGWTDGSGTVPRMYQQSGDNNWIFNGTSSTGAARGIMSIFMRSDVSDLIFSTTTLFSQALRVAPTEYAAAGTTLAGATPLTQNFCRVTSATVPTASGVRISATNGRPQVVFNETNDIIFVWPNTTTAPIDGGPAGFAVTLQAKEARAFVYFSATNEIWSYAVAVNSVDLTGEAVSAQESSYPALDLTTIPAVEPPTANINHSVAYGQSLSIASEGSPGLSTTAKYDNLMFGDSVAATQNVTPSPTWDQVGTAAFNPLSPGTDDREHSLIGALNTYRMMDFLSRKITADTTYKHCASTAGIGGVAIAALVKGAVPDIYNRLLECTDKTHNQATAQGLSYKIASMIWMQGESDQLTTKATYKAALQGIIANFQADAIAESGQTLPPAIFMYQTTARNGNYNTTKLGVQMAQLEIAQTDSTVFMVGPIYPVNDSGNLHLSANGYRHWGSQLGKVMHRVWTLGQRWLPLHITSGTIKGNRVLLTYHVPFGPLVIDQPWLQTGWYPTDPTTGAANSPFYSADQGFTVKTTTGIVQPIASVVLVGENQVLITLQSPADTATYNFEVWYADGLDSHVGHGCIRDSDPAVADDYYKDLQTGQAADERNYLLSGKRYPLYNWAVAQVVALTEV